MEHNYYKDPNFLAKKEQFINFIGNFEVNQGHHEVTSMAPSQFIQFFEANLARCVKSLSLQKIKTIFRSNKNVCNYFNPEQFNIAVHIRRLNSHDSRIEGTDTADAIFLNTIHQLRIRYADKKPLFHIYSQGNKENFKAFQGEDVRMHLNETVEDSFAAMVFADVLVTAASSLSYTAGILSDGVIYYVPFWHSPLPHWISVETLPKK
jgi:hypothetical protein